MSPAKKVDGRDHTTAGRRDGDIDLSELLAEFRELKEETHAQTKTLKDITNELTLMREILTAWNNLRGTGAVLKVAGRAVIGLAAVGAAVLALVSLAKGLMLR